MILIAGWILHILVRCCRWDLFAKCCVVFNTEGLLSWVWRIVPSAVTGYFPEDRMVCYSRSSFDKI
jgi:hypothetical protein